MVNHTIHTCEQRVRFPLSAIVILFTILPLFSILHHTTKPTHIYSPDPNKNHITIRLYNISVSILHSLLQNQNYIFIFSYHTHYYFLPNIYILSYLLLITTTTIYQLTIKIHHYLRQIDIYLTYTIITYLLTLKIEPTYLFTYFIPTIV